MRLLLSNKKKLKGFTLVEYLVSTAITAFTIVSVTNLFITYMTTKTKMQVFSRIKNDGNSLIDRLQFEFRNAQNILSPCSKDGTSSQDFFYINNNGDVIHIYIEEHNPTNRVVFLNTTNNVSEYLTSSFTDLSDFYITCYQGDDSLSKYINVKFNLSSNAFEADPLMSLKFETGITVRNSIYEN